MKQTTIQLTLKLSGLPDTITDQQATEITLDLLFCKEGALYSNRGAVLEWEEIKVTEKKEYFPV